MCARANFGERHQGSILLYIQGADEGQSDELSHKFNLALTDDPVPLRDQEPPDDVVDLLEHWHNYIVGRVAFPRVFTIMSQATVPADGE